MITLQRPTIGGCNRGYVIEVGGSTDNDSDDGNDSLVDDDGNDSLVDDEDRRFIDQALRELMGDCTETPTSTKQTKCSTLTATETARHKLLSTFQDDDRNYLESILPSTKTFTSLTYYSCYSNFRQHSDLPDPHEVHK